MKATRGQGDLFSENPAAEQQQTGYHGAGEGDQHHAKKSVLKKMKEKAKKLKDSTIGKKKHREGEGGQPHEGEVREHGLPLDYMEEEEEEEVDEEVEDEEGNFLGADPPPGNLRGKTGQSEPFAAVRPGISKPPPPEGPDPLAGGSERGSKEEADVPEPERRGTGVRPFDEDPNARRSEPAVVSPDISEAADRKPVVSEVADLGPVLQSIKDLKFGEEFPTVSHDQFAPEPPLQSETELSGSKVAAETKPTSAVLTEKVAFTKDAIASLVHLKRNDEGVSATKYVMEKLSPGEEDRALSEVIKDAIHAPTKVGDRDDSQAGAKEWGSETATGYDLREMVEKVKEVAASLVGKDQLPHDGAHQASDLGGEGEGAEERKLQESTI